MGTVGDCYDNAPMKSFWGSVQVELLNRQRRRTNLELAVAIADYIEHFYNPARRHSALGYLTPSEFEDLQSPQPQATLSQDVAHQMGHRPTGGADGIRTRDLLVANQSL